MNLEFLRIGLKLLLGELLKKLPPEIRESFISQAVLAIANAESAEQVELEITAIIGEIKKTVIDIMHKEYTGAA